MSSMSDTGKSIVEMIFQCGPITKDSLVLAMPVRRGGNVGRGLKALISSGDIELIDNLYRLTDQSKAYMEDV